MPLLITAAEALAQLEGELAELRTEPPPTNLDPHATFRLVLSLIEPLMAHRPGLLELGGERAVRALDRLELVALAALGAQLEVDIATPPARPSSIAAALTQRRERMRVELEMLVQRGLVDGRAAREVRYAQGYRALCADVLLLTTVFQTHWDAVAAHTALSREGLSEVEALVDALMEALGPRRASAAETRRDRALSLLIHTYDEVQRALSYLRWRERDAHLVAPSLWKREGSGPRKNRRRDVDDRQRGGTSPEDRPTHDEE